MLVNRDDENTNVAGVAAVAEAHGELQQAALERGPSTFQAARGDRSVREAALMGVVNVVGHAGLPSE